MLFAAPSALLALGSIGLVLYARAQRFDDVTESEMNASLGNTTGGASLEEGPTPVSSSSYDLSSHQTLSRVILLIRENYVEPERINSYEMFIAALDYIQKAIPEVMVDDTQAPERVKVSVGAAEQTFDLGGLDQLWEVTMALRDIFRFLQTQLQDPDQRREVEYAAINGMLSTLDPHSVLLKPESFDEVKLSTKGEFGGLGIVISIRDGSLTVISPIEGTPAARAGLKSKDRIVKIGEESTINMNLEEAVQRLRGKPGSKVNVWVTRKGWTESKRFQLTRAIIKIESVSSELLEDGVGYLRIKSFQNNTYDDMHEALEKLRKKNKAELKGLVLDLRNNPGGLLDQAILVSDRFIDKGPIVITVGEGNKKREEKPAHTPGTERDYPIAVLVNGGSASASEIVSGALKNSDRALLIGSQTFGKGSVQVLYDFKDKSALKLTIAQYLTPGDVSIQSVGITPDIEIMPALVQKEGVHLFVDDDSPREKDLEKHLSRHGDKSGNATTEAALRIVHLVDPTPEEKQGVAREENVEEEEEAPEKFEYDFETRLAHDVLAQSSGAVDRKALLQSGLALFKTRATEEEQRIESRMKELGIDWSTGQESGEATAQVELSAVVKGQKGSPHAGDTLTLTATARNTSQTPIYRAYGVSNSDNPFLRHLEFVFGKLSPGQTRSFSVDVKLPEEMSPRADNVSVALSTQDGRTRASSSAALVSIDEAPKPRFAYSAQLDDRRLGNGDGLLQPGEKLDLIVDVTNIGPGEAKDAVVTLKNLAGEAVFLDRGREKLGAMKVGATKTVTLKFSLRDDVEVEKAPLRISMWDSGAGASLSEALNLPVLPAQKAHAEARLLRVGGNVEVPIYAGAAEAATILGYAKPSAVLKSDVGFDSGFRRVEVQPGLIGFVRDSDFRAQKGGQKTAAKTLRILGPQAAPLVALDLPSLVSNEAVLHLKGVMSDERTIKDCYVFVNDKKVYYRALGPLVPNEQGQVTAPLELALPLKDGSNSISIVVRETDDVVTRKSFGILRGQAGAVAERSTSYQPTQH